MAKSDIYKFVLLPTFLLLSLSTSFSQPCIQFQNKLFDFDTVAMGHHANCRFEFKNTRNEPLLVTDVVTSCGCTVAGWTKSLVLPGGNGYVYVSYNTSLQGSFRKTILVKSNTEKKEVLQIKGYVASKKKNIIIKKG